MKSIINKLINKIKSLLVYFWNEIVLNYIWNAKIDRTTLLFLRHDQIEYLVFKGRLPQAYFYRNKTIELGKIRGGDWDLCRVPFRSLEVAQYFDQRYIDGRGIAETSYFQLRLQRSLLKLKKENKTAEINLNELNLKTITYLKRFEATLEKIKTEGFKLNREINRKYKLDEITCRIGRDGYFLFEDGRHRLAIALFLKLESIPVLITWRHKEWIRLRKLFMNLPASIKDELSNVYNHPDVPGLTRKKNKSVLPPDFNPILSPICDKKKTILEIGPRAGFGLLNFYQMFSHYYMLEHNKSFYQILYNLIKIKNIKNATLFHSAHFVAQFTSYFDVVYISDGNYLKNDDDYQELCGLFSFVKCKELYVENNQDLINYTDSLSNKIGLKNKTIVENTEDKTLVYY